MPVARHNVQGGETPLACMLTIQAHCSHGNWCHVVQRRSTNPATHTSIVDGHTSTGVWGPRPLSVVSHCLCPLGGIVQSTAIACSRVAVENPFQLGWQQAAGCGRHTGRRRWRPRRSKTRRHAPFGRTQFRTGPQTAPSSRGGPLSARPRPTSSHTHAISGGARVRECEQTPSRYAPGPLSKYACVRQWHV